MIEGAVTPARVPHVEIPVGARTWPAVIDTGFNGDLELPDELRGDVNPQFVGVVESSLAAGQTIVENCYLVEFAFDGETRNVEATFVDSDEILVGTGMLMGHQLSIDFMAGTVLLARHSG